MAANLSLAPKTIISATKPSLLPRLHHHLSPHPFRFISVTRTSTRSGLPKLSVRASTDNDYSSGRSNSSNEQRETIMLPGCDYNHWLIVMEFPKDPAPTREQMIETYLNTLATVLGRYYFFFPQSLNFLGHFYENSFLGFVPNWKKWKNLAYNSEYPYAFKVFDIYIYIYKYILFRDNWGFSLLVQMSNVVVLWIYCILLSFEALLLMGVFGWSLGTFHCVSLS